VLDFLAAVDEAALPGRSAPSLLLRHRRTTSLHST